MSGEAREDRSGWELPLSYRAEKKPNGFVFAFYVWCLSLALSLICWILFMLFYASDDTFTDRLFFGLYLALITGVVYSILYVLSLLPFFLICCARPRFWFRNIWLIFIYSVFVGFLSLEVISQLFGAKSVIFPFDWVLLYGLAYGTITGIGAWIRITRTYPIEVAN